MSLRLVSIVVGAFCSAAITNSQASQTLSAGQLNYMLQCQGCHKADGSGVEGSVPDLRTFGRSFLAVPQGRQFFVSVPGSANSPLTDQELAEVLNFIITDILDDAEDQADSLSRFTDEEIARYRSIEIPDVLEQRKELVDSVSTGC